MLTPCCPQAIKSRAWTFWNHQKTEPKYKFLNPLKDSPITGLYYPSWIWTRPVSHAITWVISMQQVISNWYVNDIKVAQTGHFKTVQNMHFAFTLDNIFEYFLYSWIIYICNYFRLFILCFWSSDHCLLQLLRIVSNSAERLKILNASQSERTFQSWSCCMLFTSTQFWRTSIWFFAKTIKTLAIHNRTSKTKYFSIFIISTMYKRVYFFAPMIFNLLNCKSS